MGGQRQGDAENTIRVLKITPRNSSRTTGELGRRPKAPEMSSAPESKQSISSPEVRGKMAISKASIADLETNVWTERSY